MELQYRRHDGTLVAIMNGFPYHVIPEDPLFPIAQAVADAMGDDLPLEPLPPIPEPIVLTKIFKSDIWRKATDAEAVTIKAGLLQQPVRLQELWQSVSYISTTDELYTALRAGFVAAFGEARTNELLEATE